jgi:hypothetical protein
VIENQIDEVLRAQRAAAPEEENSLDAATLNVAAHRLEDLFMSAGQLSLS